MLILQLGSSNIVVNAVLDLVCAGILDLPYDICHLEFIGEWACVMMAKILHCWQTIRAELVTIRDTELRWQINFHVLHICGCCSQVESAAEFRTSIVSMIETWYIITLEFTKMLDAFDECSPLFNRGCCLQQCLLVETTNFKTKCLFITKMIMSH